jgi:hypothetical protein
MYLFFKVKKNKTIEKKIQRNVNLSISCPLINDNVTNVNYNCDCCIIFNKSWTYWFQWLLELIEDGVLCLHAVLDSMFQKVNLKWTCETNGAGKRKQTRISCRGESNTVSLSVRLLKLP